MVEMAEKKPAPVADFPRLTRESAADPRTFCRLAEAVASESVKAHSKIKALDGQRILDILNSVCFDLTRRYLHQASQIENDPLSAFRKLMEKGEAEVRAVQMSMASIDAHWVQIEADFGDKAPVIPPPETVKLQARVANDRLMRTAESYLEKLIDILNDMLTGETNSLEAQRKLETIRHGCLMLTGEELGDVADRWTNPIRRFRGPLQTPETELNELRKAYYALTGPTPQERTRWDEIIRATKNLQWQARHDPAKFMAYVFRDADPSRAGEVLDLQWFHVSWFGVWLDPTKPNSLVMAPPGHGKSFCVCAMDIWEVGRKPELRVLVLYDKGDSKVAKEISRIEGIMQSDLFRAVFPEIRILDRSGKIEGELASHAKSKRSGRRHSKTQHAFTVGRKNDVFSREATFEGAGVLSNINGDGFDRVRGDDFSPPQCREEPFNRKRYAERFTSVVEERLRDPRDSRIRVIHTPWHPEDAPGRIRKGVAQGKLPGWRCQIEPYAIRDDAKGKAISIWPAKITTEHLENRKFRLGANYDCSFRLQASDVSRRALSKLMYYNAIDDENTMDADRLIWQAMSEGQRTLSIDPAASDERNACDTGVIDGRITLAGQGYVPSVWMLHLSSPKLLEWIVEELMRAWQVDKLPYDEILLESQGGVKGMVDLYEDWLPKEWDRIGFPQALWPSIVKPGTRVGQGDRGNNRGKMKRLREASAYLVRGAVRLAGTRQVSIVGGKPMNICVALGGTPMATFSGMLKEFDGTTKADAIDALCQWILFNKNRFVDPFAARTAPTVKAAKEDGPMATAMAGMMQQIMTVPDETSNLQTDIERTYSKWKPAKGSQQEW
jgi:hypothetical protein